MTIQEQAAAKFTSEDIKALRAYVDELEALIREEQETKLSPIDWDEVMPEIQRTGIIPDKYKGRIAEQDIIVHMDIVDGKPTEFPEGVIRKAYYDISEAEFDVRYSDIEKKYHDVITKAIISAQGNEGEQIKVRDIINELLKNPKIRRVIETETGISTLAPLGSIPNGESLNFLHRVINASKGGRVIEQSTGNRNEIITIQQKGKALKFSRENKQSGSAVIVEIDQADKYLSKTNKTFTKVLLFTLQKMTAQNFPLEVGFPLQELVDLGMYSNTNNARRAVKEFFAQQTQTRLTGSVKKGRKTVKEEEGILFYHYKMKNGYVTLSVNENFNIEFIANYFTVFPRFAYALSNNAFSLVRYIFFLARQNTRSIKETGTFRIRLESVRAYLGLPSVDEVKNRMYRLLIIAPIEKAIEEIEDALQNVPEAEGCKFTITPYTDDTGNISKWLEGYLEIGLDGKFAETFIRIATKAEAEREQFAKLKQKELARIIAKEESKAKKGKKD